MKGKGFGFRPRVTLAGTNNSTPHSNPLTDRSNKETPRLHSSILGGPTKQKGGIMGSSSSVSANRFEKKKVSFAGKRDGINTSRTPIMSARKMSQNQSTSTSQFSSYHDTSLQTSYTGFLKSTPEDIRGDSQNRPDLIEYGADVLLQQDDYRHSAQGEFTPEIEQPKFCASPELEKSPRLAHTPNAFNPSVSMSLARSTFLNHTTLKEARAMRQSVDPRSSIQNQSALYQSQTTKEIRQSKPRFQSLIKKPPGRMNGLYQSASKTPTSRFTPNKMQISVNDKHAFEDTHSKRFANTTKQTTLASPSMRFSHQFTYSKPEEPMHNTNLLSRTSFKSKVTKHPKPSPKGKMTELVTEFERGSPREKKGFVANPSYKSNFNRHKISLIKEESRDSTLTQLQTSPSPPKVQMPTTSYMKRQPNQFQEISPLPTEETAFARELKADCDEFQSFDLDLTNSDMPFSTNLPQNLLNEFDEEHVLPEIEESMSFSRNMLETSTPSKKLSEIGSKSKGDASPFSKPMDQIVPVPSLSRSKMYSSNHSSLVELGPSLANQLKDLVELTDEPQMTEEQKRHKFALKIQRMWWRFKAMRVFPQLKLDKKALTFRRVKSRILLQQIVDTFRENAQFVRELRLKYKGSSKLLSIIRIQLFMKRKIRKTMSVKRFKAKLRGLVEGWRVRRIMRLAEIDSIVKGILDLKNLIAEMSTEKETKNSKAFLEQIKKDLPVRIKEFNDMYHKAYEERKWEISPSEEKKAQMRRTMKVKKHKFNQTAKYQPPRLGSKRPHIYKHNGLSKMSETTASLNLGISTELNEDSFSQMMNQTMASAGMDSFLGMKRAHQTLAPKTCREKKNIRMSDADPFNSQRGGVSHKHASPKIQQINISPLSTKAAGLQNSASYRRLEVKPSPRIERGPFQNELHNIMRDLEKVYGIAMRKDSPKVQCDAELENILQRIRTDYASLWAE